MANTSSDVDDVLPCVQEVSKMEHLCKGDVVSTNYTWWAKDARGIELCRVCDECEEEKIARYRPEILSGYDQGDVDEPIEAEEY
jgi:hypothetical protein